MPDSKLTEAVKGIIGKVVAEGDAALRKFTRDFDGVDLQEIRVSPEVISQSLDALAPETRSLFANAIKNVEEFHQKQLPESWLEETPDGSKFGMQFKPIQRVGCYVPGGRAAYPSTVIMTVVPAQIAGVAEIVLTSPPSPHGEVNSMILAVAGLLGVDEVYAIGGVQAIAALALGTQSVAKV
ncbi:MAG: histidinol dehydrogenase, partial [bacterium]